MVGQNDFKVLKQGMAEGTLFIEIDQYLLNSDRTKIKIDVYNNNNKIESTTTNFLSPRSFD